MSILGNRDIITGAIRRKKFIYVFLVAVIAAGIIGLFKMNRDELPTFHIKQGLVAAVYPGATAEEVSKQITKPLEELICTFPEVDRTTLKSVSKDGICYIYIDLTVPMEKIEGTWSKIKHTLNVFKLQLPPAVMALVVLDDFSDTTALLIALESDDKGNSEIKKYAEDLCARLRHIPSLARATVLGAEPEEIAITLDPDRLSAYGISPASLMLQYKSSTLSTSGGIFDTDYATSPIVIDNPVTSEQEIEDCIVYCDDMGNYLRLKDIATVERRLKKDSPSVSYNGHSAVVINVCMRDNNNIVEFGQEVEKALIEFEADLPDSVHVSRITDQPKVVEDSIMSFIRDLFIAMLVVIFVMMMLFPIRSALIAGSGVPVCVAVTLAVMYMTGMELNTVTLAALIVVLGMIVDDSIITMDGYMDRLGRYGDRTEAARKSARDLFMPMFIATFALSAMFFPTKYITSGYLGDFVASFPWIITIALACSLAYAMLVVPSLEIRFIKKAHSDDTLASRAQNWFFERMQKLYNRCEIFCFNHFGFTIALGIIAISLGILMFSKVNIQMLPGASRDCFATEIVLDNNSSLRDTKRVSDSLSAILCADPRVKSVTAFVGESAPRFHATYTPLLPGPNVAQLIVNTVSPSATVEVLKEYESKYEHLFPGAIIYFKQIDYQHCNSIEVILQGGDTEELKPLADSIRWFMYGMSDCLKYIHSEGDETSAFVDVSLQPEEAARLGIDKTMVSLSLDGMLAGRNLANIYEDGEKIPINLYGSNIDDNMDYADLGRLLVPSLKPGVYVPLNQVANITPGWKKPLIVRTKGEESIIISANMKMGLSQPVAMKSVDSYINGHIRPLLPEGVKISYGGLSETNDMVFPEIAWSFIAAVAILFLFLLIHFRKWSISILTMLLSTLCLFGASFGLWAFNMDLTMPAVLGLISLVGIIVRNGIIMFDYAEYLRSVKGFEVREAAILAGQRRMRPIFLTSCTTALGVLPMILSGDILWMPMGLVICFGTMLSIGLVVLVMPVSYWLVFKNSK
ncbi:MAG: efflux RND transporter permease subunit [Bacteroidales bacterium]|nr:efflux RND transporter permease subunit [Candidatus Cacconaster caballi]